MIVKLLNGDLLSIESKNVNVVKHTIARHLQADVDDVQLVDEVRDESKGDSKGDSKGEDEKFVFAMIVRKPRVIELDLKNNMVIHEICLQISNRKFINPCLIQYYLDHITNLPNRTLHAFAENPHPLIVEYLLAKFLCPESAPHIPLPIHMYLVRNPSDEIVHHPRFLETILASPEKITLLHDLTANTNPHARKILVDLLKLFPDAVSWTKLCGIPNDEVVKYVIECSPLGRIHLLNTYEFLNNPSRYATRFAMENEHLINPSNRFIFHLKCLSSDDPDVVRYAIGGKVIQNPVVHLLHNSCDAAVDLILSQGVKSKLTREHARNLASNPSDRIVEYLCQNSDMKYLTDSPEFLCSPHPLAVPRQVEWIRRHSTRKVEWERIVTVLPYVKNPDTIWHLLKHQKIRDNTPHSILLLSRVEDVQVLGV